MVKKYQKKMKYEDYKKKCKTCGYINNIPAEWFNNTLKVKKHTCESCSNSVLLKVDEIRRDRYDNFYEKTEISVSSNKCKNYTMKITHLDYRSSFEIENNTEFISIGRGSSIDYYKTENNHFKLSVPDKYVSRKHAIIVLKKRQDQSFDLVLKDCNSLNGTYFNLKKLNVEDEIIIQTNDRIKLGETEVEFIQ